MSIFLEISAKIIFFNKISAVILAKHKQLHYYQGYHDICSVLLFVASNKREIFQMMERLSLYHLRSFLNKTLDVVICDLYLIPSLLFLCNEKLFRYIIKAKVEPFFALSWVITWFSHELRSFDAVCRLFDAFLSTHPYFFSDILSLKLDQLI